MILEHFSIEITKSVLKINTKFKGKKNTGLKKKLIKLVFKRDFIDVP